jgi:hypothetical protein
MMPSAKKCSTSAIILSYRKRPVFKEEKAMRNKGILTLLLCMILAVTAQADKVVDYDLNRDGYNDLFDIGLLGLAWLEQDCGLTNSCNGADIYPECGDGTVTFVDFAGFMPNRNYSYS